MITAFIVAAALSHSQKGSIDCSKPIQVKRPQISHSYWIEDATCTFVFNVNSLDAVSVSRVSWPPPKQGSITVNDITYKEDLEADGHVEPFAILPMWATFSRNEQTPLGGHPIVVSVSGKAFVSFGKAEDLELTLGGVVSDSYASREWVFNTPADAMWGIHIGMFVVICLSLAFAMRFIKPLMVAWTAVSFAADMYVWSVTAAHIAGGAGGMFVAVTTVRIALLMYCFYSTIETPVTYAGQWGWPVLWKVVIPLLVNAYFVTLVIISDQSTATVILASVAILAISVVLYQEGPFLNLALLLTLIGITTNLGAGLLIPSCMYCSYLRRNYKSYRSYAV